MKGESRKEADSGFRDSLRDFSVGVVFRHVGVWKCVDSTSRPFEFALMVETNEILPRKADGPDIAGPNDPVFPDVLHNPLKRCLPGMFQYVHYLIITNDVLQHYRRTLGPPKFRFFLEEELDAQYAAGVFGIRTGDVRPQDNILQTPSAKLPRHPEMKAWPVSVLWSHEYLRDC